MWGSACARMLDGKGEGSLPSRMFGPMRKSSATGVLAASSPVVSPFAVAIVRGARTRLLSRLSNINAPEDSRCSGRLRRLGESFARSAGGIIRGWLCWATAIDPTNQSNDARTHSFNIENSSTVAILPRYNNADEELLRRHPTGLRPPISNRRRLAPDRQNGAHNNSADNVIAGVDRPESARPRLPDISQG